MSEAFPGVDGLDDEKLSAAIDAWRKAIGLEPGEYLCIRERRLVPYGYGISSAIAAAICAYEETPARNGRVGDQP